MNSGLDKPSYLSLTGFRTKQTLRSISILRNEIESLESAWGLAEGRGIRGKFEMTLERIHLALKRSQAVAVGFH